MPRGLHLLHCALMSGLAIALTLTPRSSRAADAANTKAECIDAHEQGQRLRKAGQWRRARERFVACAVEVCPGAIRQECGPWVKELDDALPSVVLVVRDERGANVTGARVQIDDAPAIPQPATALVLDPGSHTFRISAPEYIEERIVETLREREQGRVTTVTLRLAAKSAVSDQAPLRSRVSQDAPSSTPGPNIAAWTALGATTLALGSFALFSALGRGLESDRADTCAPFCPRDALVPIERYYAVADISLVTSVVLAGVTAVLFYVNRAEPKRAEPKRAQPKREAVR